MSDNGRVRDPYAHFTLEDFIRAINGAAAPSTESSHLFHQPPSNVAPPNVPHNQATVSSSHGAFHINQNYQGSEEASAFLSNYGVRSSGVARAAAPVPTVDAGFAMANPPVDAGYKLKFPHVHQYPTFGRGKSVLSFRFCILLSICNCSLYF
jgi:hypothetical protein